MPRDGSNFAQWILSCPRKARPEGNVRKLGAFKRLLAATLPRCFCHACMQSSTQKWQLFELWKRTDSLGQARGRRGLIASIIFWLNGFARPCCMIITTTGQVERAGTLQQRTANATIELVDQLGQDRFEAVSRPNSASRGQCILFPRRVRCTCSFFCLTWTTMSNDLFARTG